LTAEIGQKRKQLPHRMQFSAILPAPSRMSTACAGHTEEQPPQNVHRAWSME
jgi:hypothetical protein